MHQFIIWMSFWPCWAVRIACIGNRTMIVTIQRLGGWNNVVLEKKITHHFLLDLDFFFIPLASLTVSAIFFIALMRITPRRYRPVARPVNAPTAAMPQRNQPRHS